MRKVYKLENLCCANCAAKIEDRISKLAGVQAAKVNFMLQRFTLEAPDDEFDGLLEQSLDIFKKVEPDVVVHVK